MLTDIEELQIDKFLQADGQIQTASNAVCEEIDRLVCTVAALRLGRDAAYLEAVVSSPSASELVKHAAVVMMTVVTH